MEWDLGPPVMMGDFAQLQHAYLALGVAAGYISAPVCETHDGTPMTPEEEEARWESDPCIHVIRPYLNAEHQAAIEAHGVRTVERKKDYE